MSGGTGNDGARIAIETADWRARVFALYAEVRAAADPAAGHALWRAGRDELFRTHPATPLLPEDRPGFRGLPIADYDPGWRAEVPVVEAEPLAFDFETGTDGTVHYERIGRVELPRGAGTVDLWRHSGYGGGLFLPLRDGLAGRPGGTYGGGRYLLDTIKGADLGADAAAGTVVLDLNFAYNPSCAYDPAWACPLAPVGDRVSTPIPVGELYG
jgi:uncharacterized protein